MKNLILALIVFLLGILMISSPVYAQTAPTSDYLANPGIGWQEAHTFSNPILPEIVAYQRSQYNWALQNPADGIYNFAPVDAGIAAAVAAGRQFSFRIYTVGSGGVKIPQWAIDKGATTINNLPDFSNCEYQSQWGKFVDVMRQRYDGNPNIAFIDISGYGNFNEWSWTDGQTDITPNSLDHQARQRLADMFIGGSGTIQCKNKNGQTQSVAYSYPGFKTTQLIMPYAGVRESTFYVNSKRPDVGFRNDCLGRAGEHEDITSKVGSAVQKIWPVAPVVFEFCGNTSTTDDLLARADTLLKWAHGSITHDNFSGNRSVTGLENILQSVGYRYYVSNFNFPSQVNAGSSFNLATTWTNSGYAPNYPRMGQTFAVHGYLIDQNGNVSLDQAINANTATWLPGSYDLNTTMNLPTNLAAGTYTLKVGIIELRTGKFINLAMNERDQTGRYPLGNINVIAANQTIATPTPTGLINQTPTALPVVYVNPPSPKPTPQNNSSVNTKPVPMVAGASTQVRELPVTGVPNYFIPSLGSLIFVGVYLRKRFRLV